MIGLLRDVLSVVGAVRSVKRELALARLRDVYDAVEAYLPAGAKWDTVAAVEYVVRSLRKEADALAGERSALERELAIVRTVLLALVPTDQHWRSTTGLAEWLLAVEKKQTRRSRK